VADKFGAYAASAGLVPSAISLPRNGGTRPLRRTAVGKRATHLAGGRVPSAHGLRATNISLARLRRGARASPTTLYTPTCGPRGSIWIAGGAARITARRTCRSILRFLTHVQKKRSQRRSRSSPYFQPSKTIAICLSLAR